MSSNDHDNGDNLKQKNKHNESKTVADATKYIR